MIYTAITIADEILKIAKDKNKTLTPLQLMKLVYIAHGYSFPVLGRDLFADRIEAWRYGPVIPDLYRATKRFGRDPIPHDVIDAGTSVDPHTRAFLEDVFEKYGSLSGYALSSLTHKSGTPWDQVYDEKSRNIEIPDDIIKEHYQKLADEWEARRAPR